MQTLMSKKVDADANPQNVILRRCPCPWTPSVAAASPQHWSRTIDSDPHPPTCPLTPSLLLALHDLPPFLRHPKEPTHIRGTTSLDMIRMLALISISVRSVLKQQSAASVNDRLNMSDTDVLTKVQSTNCTPLH